MSTAAVGKPAGGLPRNVDLIARRLGRRRVPGRRTWPVVAIGAAITLALVLIAVLYLDDQGVRWGRRIPHGLRLGFLWITRFGKSDWLLLPSAVVGAYVLIANWNAVSRRMAAAWAEIGALILYFFVAVGGAGLVTNLTKFIIGRSRPELYATDGSLTFTPFAMSSSHYSFPSGHATTVAAAAVAVVLMMRRWRWLAALAVLVALAIVVSRVIARAHFVSDVIAGSFIGGTFAWLLAEWMGRTGVAFQLTAAGGLVPKTVAVRGIARQQGVVAVLTGLSDAVWGAFSRRP